MLLTPLLKVSYLVGVINDNKWKFMAQLFKVIKKGRCSMCLWITSKSLTTMITCCNWIWGFKKSCEVIPNNISCLLTTSIWFSFSCSFGKRNIMVPSHRFMFSCIVWQVRLLWTWRNFLTISLYHNFDEEIRVNNC